MEHLRSLGHSAFVLGYSGVAGSALVKELNKANIFKKVVLIGRRVLPLDVGPEFEQAVVDFDNLHEYKEAFKGLDAGFCCLGAHSRGTREEDYIRITRDYVVISAQIAKEQGCKHFTIVTSKGAKKNSSFLAYRVKADLEERLWEINFDRLSIFRPAMILESGEKKTHDNFARKLFKPVVSLFPTALSVPDEKLARAMVNNAMTPPKPSVKEIYENSTIHQLAEASS